MNRSGVAPGTYLRGGNITGQKTTWFTLETLGAYLLF